MAEYYISYPDFSNIIESEIKNSMRVDKLSKYKAEILAALTGDYENGQYESANEMIALWENKINRPSEMVFGTKYIRVSDLMLSFFKLVFGSGLVAALVEMAEKNFSSGNLPGGAITVGSCVVITLWEYFTNVKQLDDSDFCVFKQACTHFYEHRDFTIDTLKEWFPNSHNPICNMHNDLWKCDYYDDKTDFCCILNEEQIKNALKSLCDKGLLFRSKNANNEYVYKFKK